MSLHFSPSSEQHATPFPSGEFVASQAGSSVLGGLATPHDGKLSLRLDNMGVTLDISAFTTSRPAFSPRQPAGNAGAAEQGETIHLQFMRVGDDLVPVPGSHDPVVRNLARALEAAEHSEGEFDGIYADALRLAIVTRMLDLGSHSAPASNEPAPAPDAPPKPSRLKSGLPKWRLKRVESYVDAHLGEEVTLADMAASTGLSRMHFAAQFRIATGLRPHEYLLRRRIERAQQLLLETADPLVQIALEVGFQTQAHFTTVFRRFVGDTPHQWRSANRLRA